MVSKLAFNLISLLKQFNSAFFVRLSSTYWTRPLIAIKSIKWVSVLTVCFSRVYSAYISRIKIIFFYSNHPQMSWINTVLFSANMVYNKSFLNITNKHIEWNTMCPSSFMSKIKSTVSVFIKILIPQITVSNFIKRLIEVLEFTFCISFHAKHCSHSYSLVK